MPQMSAIDLHETASRVLPVQAKRFVFVTRGSFTARRPGLPRHLPEPPRREAFCSSRPSGRSIPTRCVESEPGRPLQSNSRRLRAAPQDPAPRRRLIASSATPCPAFSGARARRERRPAPPDETRVCPHAAGTSEASWSLLAGHAAADSTAAICSSVSSVASGYVARSLRTSRTTSRTFSGHRRSANHSSTWLRPGRPG